MIVENYGLKRYCDNDLEDTVPNIVNINTCKYADDCTQYQIVERSMCSSLQEAVDGLSGWANTNKMALNPNKKQRICGFASQTQSKNHLASKSMMKK
jgi:hypothetical protein